MTISLLQFFQQQPFESRILGILGVDDGLTEMIAQQVKSFHQNAGFEPLCLFTHETEIDWMAWAKDLTAPSLWQRQPCWIRIHLDDKSVISTLTEALSALMQTSTTHRICITLPTIDKNFSKSPLGKLIESHGKVYTLWPPYTNQFKPWIIFRAKCYNLILEKTAIDYLATYYEQDLLALEHLLQRLQGIQQPVTLARLQADPGLCYQGTIFDLLSAAFMGNFSQCHALMMQIPKKQSDMLGLLGAMNNLLQKAHQVALQGGKMDNSIWPKQRKPIETFLTRCPPEAILRLLKSLSWLDKQIKQQDPEHSWHLLAQVIYAMLKVEWLPSEEITSLSAS